MRLLESMLIAVCDCAVCSVWCAVYGIRIDAVCGSVWQSALLCPAVWQYVAVCAEVRGCPAVRQCVATVWQ
jgi:hypothetical protein